MDMGQSGNSLVGRGHEAARARSGPRTLAHQSVRLGLHSCSRGTRREHRRFRYGRQFDRVRRIPLNPAVAERCRVTYGALVPRAEVLNNVATLATILPKSTQSFVHEWLGKSLARREGHGLALILSIALTLFSARRVGSSLLRGIDIAGGVKQDRDPFAAQAVALVTVAAGALLLFAALVSLSGLAILGHVITGDVPGVAQILHVILWLTLTLGAVTALLLIYRYVPARAAIRWRWAIPGTLVAVASWLAATLAFQVYVTQFARYDSIYGSLSAVIILQLWLMLSAYIVLFGAKINAEVMRQAGVGCRG